MIGYKGWIGKDSLLENFRLAGNAVKWNVPDLVYQPGGCIVKNSTVANLRYNDDQVIAPLPPFAFCSECSFALFVQNLFKAIMVANGSLTASAPRINATMLYPLNHYFSLPDLPCEPIQLLEKLYE